MCAVQLLIVLVSDKRRQNIWISPDPLFLFEMSFRMTVFTDVTFVNKIHRIFLPFPLQRFSSIFSFSVPLSSFSLSYQLHRQCATCKAHVFDTFSYFFFRRKKYAAALHHAELSKLVHGKVTLNCTLIHHVLPLSFSSSFKLYLLE